MSELRQVFKSFALFRSGQKERARANIQWPDFCVFGEIVMIITTSVANPPSEGLCRVLTKRGIGFCFLKDLRQNSDLL